jgi:hypothetical protein
LPSIAAFSTSLASDDIPDTPKKPLFLFKSLVISEIVLPVLLHTYNHGYTYTPQFWGLWEINYLSNSFNPKTISPTPTTLISLVINSSANFFAAK